MSLGLTVLGGRERSQIICQKFDISAHRATRHDYLKHAQKSHRLSVDASNTARRKFLTRVAQAVTLSHTVHNVKNEYWL